MEWSSVEGAAAAACLCLEWSSVEGAAAAACLCFEWSSVEGAAAATDEARLPRWWSYDADVALLKGVSVDSMAQVYMERLRLNPGAAELVTACKQAGLKVLLVSGGFTYFTDRVRDLLGIDYTRSNVLELADGRLTGRMVDQPWGDICDGAEKRRMLLQTCAALGCAPGQSIAVGDGANDLPMMTEAGLSVAYHAKPRVREQAMVAINAGGLDQLLTVFGTP